MRAVEYEYRKGAGEAKVDLVGRVIRGTPIVFNRLSVDLGGFRERILPEAIDRTLRDGVDVRALVDHDSSKVIGRIKAGTLVLRKDRDGLMAKIDPPNTSYANDILESVGRGDVSGMSFGFRVLDDRWNTEDGEPIREVIDMEVREISIVSFPAYEQTDVQVALRSLQAFQQAGPSRMERLRKQFHAKGR